MATRLICGKQKNFSPIWATAGELLEQIEPFDDPVAVGGDILFQRLEG